MATAATAQWWIRTDGDDTDGGGYDSGISGATTNLCDAASVTAVSWASLTLTVTTNVLTDNNSTGLFTSSMIGNAVNVPGKGYYWISTITNSNVVVVVLGTGAATSFATLPGKVGGALRNTWSLASTVGSGGTTPGTATALVAGNIVNVRASGSGSVGSPDYSQTGEAGFPVGNTTNGYVNWVPYNGTPYVVGNGELFSSPVFHKFGAFYWSASGTHAASSGIFAAPSSCVFSGGTIDGNNQTSLVGIHNCSSCTVIGVELIGGGSSSGNAIDASSYTTQIKNCKIHQWGGIGIADSGGNGVQISNCAIYSNTGVGVSLATSSLLVASLDGCTIDNNGGDGVKLATTAACGWSRIVNNNITNNSGYGINVAAGATATNDRVKSFIDYNNVYNNTSSNYNNISAGAHDLNVDPGYSNASTGHFTPSNTALIAAAPISFA